MEQRKIQGLNEGTILIVETIRFLTDLANKDAILLIIAGGSCSGKSLLALMVEENLKKVGLPASIIGLDDYYKNTDKPEFPHNSSGRAIFDLPDSFLRREFRQDIKRLLSGSNIQGPLYDKKTHQRSTTRSRFLKANPVIIAEGLFAIKFLSDLRTENVLPVFVEADLDLRFKRRIKRDTDSLHDSEAEARRFIEERVEPHYEKWVKPQIKKADIIVVNN